MVPLTHSVIPSPIGPLTAVREDGVLVGLWMGPTDVEDLGPRDDEAFADVRAQLDEYFAGSRTSFDLALRASGNALQRAVWELIAAIPTAPPVPTASWPATSATAAWPRLWAPRAAATRSRSSSPATGSSEPTAAWSASAA